MAASWLLLTDGFHLVRLALTVEQKKKHSDVYERVFECSHCGFMIDRNLNAAINLSKGVSQTVLVCGLVLLPTYKAMLQKVLALPKTT